MCEDTSTCISKVTKGGDFNFKPGVIPGDDVIGVDGVGLKYPYKVYQALSEMLSGDSGGALSTRRFVIIPSGEPESKRPTRKTIQASLFTFPEDLLQGAVTSLQLLLKECVSKKIKDTQCPKVLEQVKNSCAKLSLRMFFGSLIAATSGATLGKTIKRAFHVAWNILEQFHIHDLKSWYERKWHIQGDDFLRTALNSHVKRFLRSEGQESEEVSFGSCYNTEVVCQFVILFAV